MKRKTQVKNYLKEIIGFHTVSGIEYQKQVLRLYDWFESNLENPAFHVRRFEKNGFNSLIIESYSKQNKPKLILLAHVDVVSAPDKMFKAKESKDGKIIGRGASDMKFAIAVYLDLLNRNIDIENKDIKVVLVSDEEIGGVFGVKALLEAGELDAEAIFLPDGGDNLQLVKAEKGFIHMEVGANGVSAHGSRPWEGKNAFDILLSGYQKLSKDFNDFSNGHWVNTVNIGKIAGGDFANVIPDHAVMKLDIRYTEKFTYEEIMEKVKMAYSDDCVFDVMIAGDNYHLDLNNAYVKKFMQTIEKHTGKLVEFTTDHGASDARYFTKYGIPVLMIKPDSGDHHALTEWVSIEGLEKYTQMVSDYIDNLVD